MAISFSFRSWPTAETEKVARTTGMVSQGSGVSFPVITISNFLSNNVGTIDQDLLNRVITNGRNSPCRPLAIHGPYRASLASNGDADNHSGATRLPVGYRVARTAAACFLPRVFSAAMAGRCWARGRALPPSHL